MARRLHTCKHRAVSSIWTKACMKHLKVMQCKGWSFLQLRYFWQASQDVELSEALFTFSYIQTSQLRTMETLEAK